MKFPLFTCSRRWALWRRRKESQRRFPRYRRSWLLSSVYWIRRPTLQPCEPSAFLPKSAEARIAVRIKRAPIVRFRVSPRGRSAPPARAPYLAEDDVAVVQPGCFDGADKELRSVGVLARVGHAHPARAVMLDLCIREMRENALQYSPQTEWKPPLSY